MSGFRSELELNVEQAIQDKRDELVALTSELVAFDTTAREPDDPPRDEETLQRALQHRLTAIGAETDLWEPEPIATGHPFRIAAGLSFVGRPQFAARLAGRGGGRSLLLNGHIDAVDATPTEKWASPPFAAEVRDGRLYGRGANDMKGGIAALIVALETLHEADVAPRGDVVFCTNTDEESSGAGGWSCVQHGVVADAGITGEPTNFDAWIACRGAMTAVITTPGRPGHAEMPQPHWQDGGAVNAIDKMASLVESIRRLREELRARPDQQHPLLSPGGMVPCLVSGGTWLATYPESCELTCDVGYLPGFVDQHGTGRPFQDEIMRWVNAAAAADPWLAEHPLQWRWIADCPPAEVPAGHEIVATAIDAAHDVGRPAKVAGLDSWHDAATFTLLGGTPTISFGPAGLEAAHGFDEFVPVDDLVDYCAAIALIVMRWCGV